MAGYFSAPLINALLVLNFSLYICNCVRRLHLESDGLPRESLDEYLHLFNRDTFFYMDTFDASRTAFKQDSMALRMIVSWTP